MKIVHNDVPYKQTVLTSTFSSWTMVSSLHESMKHINVYSEIDGSEMRT